MKRRYAAPSITARLMGLFVLLLTLFALVLGLMYNTIVRRQMIDHYSQTMQRDAYAIAQNLSELIAPSVYDQLDETRFIVQEDTLAPYLAMTEQLTECSVFLVDPGHNVTGSFAGVVQTLPNPLLPAYLEQSIALGFMGKTPFIQADYDGDTHLTSCMPVMNENSEVLGVVLLETTLRRLGYAQVPSTAIFVSSCAVAFVLALLLAMVLSRLFTRPISAVHQVSLALANGVYETRTPILRNDEIGSLASAMNILAQRLEEARLQDQQRHIRQQNMFSTISHELRTPVTVIRGSLEALRDGVVTKPDEVTASYEQMIRESQWLQRLIRDLLELSRLQNTEFTLESSTFELGDLLGDVAMSTRALCENKGVAFACEEPSASFRFTGDYTRLRQMLLAVADNAVKFTPAGKTVSLALAADAPVITIADEGCGIAEEDVEHIFDRFHTRRSAAQDGTGLGLAIVKEAAKRHGIEIEVLSTPGDGSRFIFHFPTV